MFKRLMGWIFGSFTALVLLAWPISNIVRHFQENNTIMIVIYSLIFAVIFVVILAALLSTANKTIQRWLIIPLPLVVTGIMIGIMAMTVETRPILKDEEIQTLRSACKFEHVLFSGGQYRGTELGFLNPISGTAIYNDSIPSIHPIFIVSPDQRMDKIDTKALPLEWSPASLSDVELILCMTDDSRVDLGYCRYVGASSLEKFGYEKTVWLIEALTGKLIAERRFEGETKCPGSVSSTRTSPVYGDRIEIETIIRWAREYVER